MELQVEKTHTLSVNDQTIAVSQLPEQIKEQVKLFDQLRQDGLEKSYELNVFQLATEQKRVQLERLVMQYLEAKEKADKENKSAAQSKDTAKPEAETPAKTNKKANK